MPFDTLKLARRLEAAGFAPQQAGDMAEAIAEAVAQLPTKADLQAEIGGLRAELKAELEILKRDMTIRLGSMMAVAVGVILAGFKLIH
jgi:hypothetical protein